MATVWTLSCATAAGDTAHLEITRSLNPLPGSDTWRGIEGSGVWGDPANGYVANWGLGETLLHTGQAGGHSLGSFNKGTHPGDTGNGQKVLTGGTFPDGPFTWTCDTKK
jgi:hypothetical protein